MSSTQVVVIVVVLLVVLVVAAGLWFASRRRALRQRFGPEYDRAVADGDSRLAAERELRGRERRHSHLELRELDQESRVRYASSWEQVQTKFLDDPNNAVNEADELVTRLIADRGYPTGDYDEQVATLSVDHARTLGHYRDAHDLYLVNERGEATTEQLRRALVHYRELFADLLGEARTDDHTGARDESVRAEAAREEAAGDEAVRDETVRDETARDETARDESVRDESVRDESVRDESVRDESVRDESVRDENVRDEAAREETGPDADGRVARHGHHDEATDSATSDERVERDHAHRS